MITKEQRDRLRKIAAKPVNRHDVLVSSVQIIGLLDALDQAEAGNADLLVLCFNLTERVKDLTKPELNNFYCGKCGHAWKAPYREGYPRPICPDCEREPDP